MMIPTTGGYGLEAVASVTGPAGVVVCHPHPAFGGTMDVPLVRAVDDAMRARNLSTLRFNFRGIGGSEGASTGGLREHEDVVAVVGWLRDQGVPRIAITGYSFGALMALRALARGLAIDAYVAIGFPTTIVADIPERIADVDAALAREVPSLFVSGDRDPISEVDRIGAWIANHPHARLALHQNRGHVFDRADIPVVAEQAAAFVAARLGS